MRKTETLPVKAAEIYSQGIFGILTIWPANKTVDSPGDCEYLARTLAREIETYMKPAGRTWRLIVAGREVWTVIHVELAKPSYHAPRQYEQKPFFFLNTPQSYHTVNSTTRWYKRDSTVNTTFLYRVIYDRGRERIFWLCHSTTTTWSIRKLREKTLYLYPFPQAWIKLFDSIHLFRQ